MKPTVLLIGDQARVAMSRIISKHIRKNLIHPQEIGGVIYRQVPFYSDPITSNLIIMMLKELTHEEEPGTETYRKTTKDSRGL
jgi:hypothetical protein